MHLPVNIFSLFLTCLYIDMLILMYINCLLIYHMKSENKCEDIICVCLRTCYIPETTSHHQHLVDTYLSHKGIVQDGEGKSLENPKFISF